MINSVDIDFSGLPDPVLEMPHLFMNTDEAFIGTSKLHKGTSVKQDLVDIIRNLLAIPAHDYETWRNVCYVKYYIRQLTLLHTRIKHLFYLNAYFFAQAVEWVSINLAGTSVRLKITKKRHFYPPIKAFYFNICQKPIDMIHKTSFYYVYY